MVESESFLWEKFNHVYDVAQDGSALSFSGSDKEYLTAIGSKGYTTGKHYWRMHVACDNVKVGIATDKASPDAEIGSDPNSWACNLQTGDVTHNCKDRGAADGVSARLYKLLVPISGGVVGMVLDMEEGKVSLFFNDEYQGVMVHDPDLKKKGPIHPAVGIGGLEGKAVIVQRDNLKVPKTYTYKRNKM